MKNLKNLGLILLVLSATYLFTACGSPVKEREPIIELTEKDFRVNTLQPEMGEKQVTLKGRFTVNAQKVDQEIKWGFLWRASDEPDSELKKIYVGRGYVSTEFLIHYQDFPVGKRLMACAFVEVSLKVDDEATLIPGEEVNFNF